MVSIQERFLIKSGLEWRACGIRRIRENKWRVCYRPEYFGSQEFLAWLFNESPSKDYVVTNDRWGQGTGKKHGSVYSGPDRWQPGSLIEHKWESAMTIDQKSWGIRRNIKIEDVLTPQELISQVSILTHFIWLNFLMMNHNLKVMGH